MNYLYSLLLSLTVVATSCGEPTATTEPGPATDNEEAAGAAGEESAPNEETYTFVPGRRFGAIPTGAGLEEVEKIYGDAFEAGTLPGPEGTTYEGYYLFKDTDQEVQATYMPGRRFTVLVDRNNSPWHDPKTGLRIGTTLEELIEINGAPIDFYGFGWDYGGNVINLNEGTLDGLVGLRLKVDDDFEFTAEQEGGTLGDQELRSDRLVVPTDRIRVSQMVVFL